MRAPIFRSPVVHAAVALVAGLILKWALDAQYAVGGTMVVVLWVVPLVGVAITSDSMFPDEMDELPFFSTQENRLEFLALLSLPGLGFSIDMFGSTLAAIAFAAVGLVGVVACVRLVKLAGSNRAAGA